MRGRPDGITLSTVCCRGLFAGVRPTPELKSRRSAGCDKGDVKCLRRTVRLFFAVARASRPCFPEKTQGRDAPATVNNFWPPA